MKILRVPTQVLGNLPVRVRIHPQTDVQTLDFTTGKFRANLAGEVLSRNSLAFVRPFVEERKLTQIVDEQIVRRRSDTPETEVEALRGKRTDLGGGSDSHYSAICQPILTYCHGVLSLSHGQ